MDDDTRLGGPAYPKEVTDEHPELGLYDHTPGAVRWAEIPGLVQIVIGAFVPGKGWLTTKRSIIYGGRHGRMPLIENDVDAIMEIVTPEVRGGIRAMKHRLKEDS